MVQAPAITSQPPEKASQYFEGLRRDALEQVRKLAGATWSDHNLHDPGITILEAFCYAMTELGMRIELDIADLIRSGSRRARAELPPAHRVMPCAPVTAGDLRRVLFDHYLVGDAWLSVGVPDRVEYFEAPSADPPLTYAPGTARVTPDGLFEVLLAFEDPALNSNTFSFPVAVGPDTYTLDFALPHWDEDEALPFRNGSTGSTATMLNPGSEWRALDEAHAFFGEVRLDFAGSGGAGSVDTWVLMRIAGALEPPAAAVPGVLAAARAVVEDTTVNGLTDSYVQRVQSAGQAVTHVERYLSTWRNLCEDAVRLSVSRTQEIAVYARIEIARSTGLEELLAQTLFAIDSRLSPPAAFEDLAARRASGLSSDEIFSGPLLTHGFPARDDEEHLVRGDQIFLSDVLRLVMRPRDPLGSNASGQEEPPARHVVAVTDLSLSNYVNNRIITNKASGCLRLVEIERYRPRLSLAKSRIVLIRDDVELGYDLNLVQTRFEELRAEKVGQAKLVNFEPGWPVPVGDDLPVDDYYAFQNDLPAVFGVGEAGLPQSASPERRQQALQLRAYLFPFEQILADCAEQVVNVNRLFSPSGDETTSYFIRPLLELDDMDQLVRAFTGGTWEAFVDNPDNGFARALRAAAESEAVALDRRNRMLDHLLARHGEDAAGLGEELHRWGQKLLLQTTVNLAMLPERLRARRLRVSRCLLRAKAAFLAELPEIQALRLAGFADPLQWLPDLVRVDETAAGFEWRIERNGGFVFESTVPAATRGEAVAKAREVVVLAATAAFYDALDLGGPSNRRYVLRDGPGSSAAILARGTVGFPNLPAAAAAGAAVRDDLASLRIRESRTALERRVDHLTGIRYRGRRRLITPLDDFFETVDLAGPAFTKGWRVWSEPGFAGDVLLVGAATLFHAVETEALRMAREDIERGLQFATDEWNYRITQTGPAQHVLELLDVDDLVVAAAPAPFATAEAAEAARRRVVTHLYTLYGAEGFHLVENLLLRPHAPGDAFLSIPAGETGRLVDPYSQRLTVVWPSGYERDFSAVDGERAPARPHRFRDPEFRRHAERSVRQSCPAHVLPDIRWADRRAPGTADAVGTFERFEARYFEWLETVLIAGAAEAAIAGARDGLVASINAIVDV